MHDGASHGTSSDHPVDWFHRLVLSCPKLFRLQINKRENALESQSKIFFLKNRILYYRLKGKWEPTWFQPLRSFHWTIAFLSLRFSNLCLFFFIWVIVEFPIWPVIKNYSTLVVNLCTFLCNEIQISRYSSMPVRYRTWPGKLSGLRPIFLESGYSLRPKFTATRQQSSRHCRSKFQRSDEGGEEARTSTRSSSDHRGHFASTANQPSRFFSRWWRHKNVEDQPGPQPSENKRNRLDRLNQKNKQKTNRTAIVDDWRNEDVILIRLKDNITHWIEPMRMEETSGEAANGKMEPPPSQSPPPLRSFHFLPRMIALLLWRNRKKKRERRKSKTRESVAGCT